MTGNRMCYDDLTWQEQAACGGYFTRARDDAVKDPFYPAKGEGTKTARSFCRRCPVAQECLDYAIELNDQHGVWGGHVRRGRETERRRRQHAAGTEAAA